MVQPEMQLVIHRHESHVNAIFMREFLDPRAEPLARNDNFAEVRQYRFGLLDAVTLSALELVLGAFLWFQGGDSG
jgi:hypothetical protein